MKTDRVDKFDLNLSRDCPQWEQRQEKSRYCKRVGNLARSNSKSFEKWFSLYEKIGISPQKRSEKQSRVKNGP